MLIYKFRILFDDDENFLREIEIKPDQTFEAFHKAILSCVDLAKDSMASFFICDNKWRKQQEITLSDTDDVPADNEEYKTRLMRETTLTNCIDNPNQQLIYINDLQKKYIFFIELFRIYNNEEKVNFPRCVRSKSDIPKIAKVKFSSGATEEIDPEDDPMPGIEDEFDETSINDEDKDMFGDFFEESTSSENE